MVFGQRISSNITPWTSLLIINNSIVPFELPKMKLKDSKTILFRTYEFQAAYVSYHTDIKRIIDSLIESFKNYKHYSDGKIF